MAIIQLLDALWTRCHEQRVVQAEEAHKWVAPSPDHRKWTLRAEDLIKARDKTTRQSQVVAIVSNFVDRVGITCFNMNICHDLSLLRGFVGSWLTPDRCSTRV